MHVHDERLSGESRHREPGRIGEPVVGVDDVEVGALGDLEAEARVRLRLGDHVAAVVPALGVPGGHRRGFRGKLGECALERGDVGLRVDLVESTGAKQDLEPPLVEEPFLEQPPDQGILGVLALVVRSGLHGQIDELDVLEDASDAIDGLLDDLLVRRRRSTARSTARAASRSPAGRRWRRRAARRLELRKRIAQFAGGTHQRDPVGAVHRARRDRLGEHERDPHPRPIHRLDESVARRPQPSGDEGGELPAEHEDARWHDSPWGSIGDQSSSSPATSPSSWNVAS